MFEDLNNQDFGSEDTAMQEKVQANQRNKLLDKELYKEIKNICKRTDPLAKYSKIKDLRKGARGVVFIAKNLTTQKQVAIKTVECLKNHSVKELILNELRVLIQSQDFNHKNLVTFHEAYYIAEQDTLWLVFEYMNG